jgi:hypothetical protein
MPTTKSASEHDDNRRASSELDGRYGEIGISAVAAAVRCRGEQRAPGRARHTPQESD